MKVLIIIDVQNGFLPGGALPVPDGDAVIPIINQLQTVFPLVVATQDWHPANHGSFAVNHPGKKPFEQVELNGLPQTLWPIHCVQNSQGADLAPALNTQPIAKVFKKGTDPLIDSYSGLFDNGHRKSTGLGEWLKEKGVREVYVCGLATDYCVKYTALDAVHFGFATHVIEDACRGVNLAPNDVAKAIEELRRAGVEILQSAELLDAEKQTTLCTGKFLSLVREGRWEYVERINATGAVVILAVTSDDKLLLVEQYRIPLHQRTIELPAGIVGDEPGSGDETIIAATKRELLEETGYAAEDVEILTTGPSSGGLASEVITLVSASNLKRETAGGGVANEDITVHEVPVSAIGEWLAQKEKEGLMVEPKVYAGLYFLLTRRAAQGVV